MNKSLFHNERGSLPAVLLAAIILAGVVIALFITIETGVMTSRQDRNYNAAIHVADTGVQEAMVEIGAVMSNLEDNELLPEALEGEGDVDGNDYRWTATLQAAGRYEVVSHGSRGSGDQISERTLVVEMGPRMLFPLALYADISMVFNGLPSGTARAYDGDGNEVDIEYLLGSAGPITLHGNCEEGVVLHGEDATINTTCVPVPLDQDAPDLDDFALEAYEDGGACASGTDDATFSEDVASGELVRGKTYCISGYTFQRDDYVSVGTADGFDDTEPARIYVEPGGDIDHRSGGQGPRINTDGNIPDPPTDAPDATALEVYMSGGTFRLGSNSYFAGVMWGPTTACQMDNGNTYTYGALVCGTFSDNGNWSHWYDIRASTITDGLLTVYMYSEQPGYAG